MKMKGTIRTIACICLTFITTSVFAGDDTVVIKLPKEPFHLPDLVLTGRLGKAVSFSNCELVSGITCTVSLNKGKTLPTRIYFTEIGNNGSASSMEIRLLYPHLKPGESGRATFRITSDSKELKLRGEWNGQWQDTY